MQQVLLLNKSPDTLSRDGWLSDFDAPNGVEKITSEQLYQLWQDSKNKKHH